MLLLGCCYVAMLMRYIVIDMLLYFYVVMLTCLYCCCYVVILLCCYIVMLLCLSYPWSNNSGTPFYPFISRDIL